MDNNWIWLGRYEFRQNNSWGNMKYDDKITSDMIIQASSEQEAQEILESFWWYFDWVENWQDCGCCWDRRSRWSNDLKFPIHRNHKVRFTTIEEYAENHTKSYCYFKDKPDLRLFYKDGTIKEYKSDS